MSIEEKIEALVKRIYGGSHVAILPAAKKQIVDLTAMGFGNAIQLLLMPPFVLLFSYTRTHKNKLIDIFIPIVGIVLILLVYLQGGYQVIRIMPLPKINLDEITTLLKQVKVVVAGLSLVK